MLRTAACKLLRSPRRQYKALVPLGSAVAVADSCPLALNLLAWTSQTCQLSKTAYGLQRQQHERQQKSQECQVVQYVRGTDITLSVKGKGPAEFALERSERPAAHKETTPARKDSATTSPSTTHDSNFIVAAVRRAKKQLQSFFLPSGYPSSVGSNYMQYTLWQAVTNVATTANGVLASTFLLYSVGLGSGAIPTAGAMNWVLKDGVGQVGTLLFGKAIAHNFDIHSKSWYFLSFVLLSTATGLEIATILVPNAFLVMGSVANMIKGLSWMAGGSTRSVFNLSFARDNNIADITAKNTSQYICASLFGTAAGVCICAYIGQSAALALTCFSILAGTALYSAYRTVKSIPLPTLNSTRLQLLAARYLKCVRMGQDHITKPQNDYTNYQQEYEMPDDDLTCDLELPTPLELAEQDPPLPWFMGDQRILNPDIRVGSNLEKLVAGNPSLLMLLITTFRYSRYLVLPEINAIHIVLHAEASPRDMVQAYLQACILRKRLKTGLQTPPENVAEMRIVLHDTLLAAEKLTPPLMRALARQGWQTEKIVVEAHRSRARW
eukprot:jgi/Chrzof1/4481/Cz14g14240.t1